MDGRGPANGTPHAITSCDSAVDARRFRHCREVAGIQIIRNPDPFLVSGPHRCGSPVVETRRTRNAHVSGNVWAWCADWDGAICLRRGRGDRPLRASHGHESRRARWSLDAGRLQRRRSSRSIARRQLRRARERVSLALSSPSRGVWAARGSSRPGVDLPRRRVVGFGDASTTPRFTRPT